MIWTENIQRNSDELFLTVEHPSPNQGSGLCSDFLPSIKTFQPMAMYFLQAAAFFGPEYRWQIHSRGFQLLLAQQDNISNTPNLKGHINITSIKYLS